MVVMDNKIYKNDEMSHSVIEVVSFLYVLITERKSRSFRGLKIQPSAFLDGRKPARVAELVDALDLGSSAF